MGEEENLNRPLLVLTIAITVILLMTLRNRSAVFIPVLPAASPISVENPETGMVSEEIPRSMSIEIEPRWPEASMIQAENSLARWQVTGGILDEIPAEENLNPREERLRFQQQLKSTLLEIASTNAEEGQRFRIDLRQGPALHGKISLPQRDGLIFESDSGATLHIPSASIIAIQGAEDLSPSDQVMDELVGPGTLTREMIALLPENREKASLLWPRWLDSGGPSFLARMLGGDQKTDILAAIQRQRTATLPGVGDSDSNSGVDRNPQELENWMKGIRLRIRRGIPGEERSLILTNHQEWQKWIDLHGPDEYGSEALHLEAKQKLHILLSDIVRSSGF